MSHDSTENRKKPQTYNERVSSLCREHLESEATLHWEALFDICKAYYELEKDLLTDGGFIDVVHEIVCEGLGMRYVPHEPWREKIRETFPISPKGDAA
ncbi:hypothetical protein IGS75_01485 [Gluconobacter sphaericus]|uniref:hypothetical protein n=1 Tax=Gluconobacter sphaericus TaxID=574987 RepID=UPI0019222BF5|nr:hypothetical protein [Gluconobacter sphaericus]QQX91343.1 hypothetical protein IGS75_01485 [Gluconobacter sphaericus]